MKPKPAKDISSQANDVVAALKRLATKSTRDGMARYAIPNDKAFGVLMGDLQKLAKQVGRNHDLALALWKTGWYEARMITAFIDEPDRVTKAQMDRWCREFDNWAICDTLCFKLFDRTPYAWSKVVEWSGKKDEYVKRAAFALLASLAGHDKQATDQQFLDCLPLIEAAATDERNFVKKGVSWALRSLGRRNVVLNRAAVELAERLANSPDASARWIGRDALRDLNGRVAQKQLAARKSIGKEKKTK
jgi:3-methyladenine DNA glycosylase AlkD